MGVEQGVDLTMRLNFGDSGKGTMGSGIDLFPKTTKKVKAKLASMISGVDVEELEELGKAAENSEKPEEGDAEAE